MAGAVRALRQSRLSMIWTGIQEAGRMIRPGYWTRLQGHPSGCAVLVIDLSNDFMRRQGRLTLNTGEIGRVAEVRAVIGAANRVINHARSQGVPVLYPSDAHTWNDPEFAAFPRHCVKKTWGAQIHPGVSQPGRMAEWIFKATTDSFEGTVLDAVLKKLRARKLIITGVVTEICIKNAAMHAKQLGYDVIVVRDAIKELDLQASNGERAIAEMQAAGVQFIDSRDVETVLGRAAE